MTTSALVRGKSVWQNQFKRVGRTHLSKKKSSTTSEAEKVTRGFFARKYVWVPVGLVVGIPTAISAAFVYNLKFDPEFYDHFEQKYPNLIETINKYVSIDNDYSQLKKRDDVGTVTLASDVQNEDLDVIVTFRSRKKLRLRVSGSVSQSDIGDLARKEANTTPNDPIVSINFDQENSDEIRTDEISSHDSNERGRNDIASVWQPHGQFSWGSLQNVEKKKLTESELRNEIEKLTVQQVALEESKLTTGRDIDDIDEEVRAIETRKKDLERALPRNGLFKFLSYWS